MKKELKAKLAELQAQQEIANFESNFNRARSITVGTAFGGTAEITMRGDGGRYLYCLLQPVEAIELIHQLAANVGCHLNLKPRDDFSSWRNWRITPEEKLHLAGHPPFANDLALHHNVGANLPPPEQQPGIQPNSMIKENQNETVATQKTINKRNTKRATKTS